MKRNLTFAAVVACVALCATTSHALTLYSQGYTFNVNVRNSHFQTINDARGSVWISGTTARIEVTAGGYRNGNTTVWLRDNQKYYTCDVRLDDPTFFYRIRNASYQSIPGAYARENTIGVFGDEFRFDIRLPKEGYTKFDRLDVRVDCSGGFVFGERVYVYDLGTERRVEVTVKRRDLGQFTNTFTVTIPADEELSSFRRELVRQVSFELQDQTKDLDEARRAALADRLAELRRR